MDQQKTEKTAQEIQLEKIAQLKERFKGVRIGQALQQQILKYAEDESLTVLNSSIAAVITSRSEWGSSGGIGYYDQVRVFVGKNQSQMKEWQWRDRYSASNDKPWLRIKKIGQIKTTKKDNRLELTIELINLDDQIRTTIFTFEKKKIETTKKLSSKKQAEFLATVEREMERILNELKQLWECKPTMFSGHTNGYGQYRQPSITKTEIHPEIGVAAFITEEQIDHRVSDRQMRYELYLMVNGQEKAKRVAEDHGYEREGGAFLTILELDQKNIVVNSKNGKSTIAIRR